MRIQDVMQSTVGERPPQQAPAPEEPGTPATPQEQEAYERVMIAASRILYEDNKSHGEILKMLRAGADEPAEAISGAAVLLLTQLDERSGGTIPESVILQSAASIAEAIAEMGQKAGVIQVDEATLQEAGQMLVMALDQQYGGTDAESLEQALAQFTPEQIQTMRGQQESASNAYRHRRE